MIDEQGQPYLDHGLSLYCSSTEDHWEDWFIAAESSEHAAKIHEYHEGYDRMEVEVEKIMVIPDHIPAEPGWLSNELLLALGPST